ncbi:E3 ubiquitin-protein ligase TRIM21 [Liparis tanakae]|uniref:E3 ubiquitin-protein ligase TRIM21 n=1 Tax=Liparis tanakae TaxID=230148 RepID=A0A4Z2JB11_9TELE|nr:E3 ubiquitin-protein ligase TRIM21 [Liparis tanakae]
MQEGGGGEFSHASAALRLDLSLILLQPEGKPDATKAQGPHQFHEQIKVPRTGDTALGGHKVIICRHAKPSLASSAPNTTESALVPYAQRVVRVVGAAALTQPQKVGVFVDYEEGLVSFYDVKAAALIYSFTGCSFNKKLLPFFSPGHNDDGAGVQSLGRLLDMGNWSPEFGEATGHGELESARGTDGTSMRLEGGSWNRRDVGLAH